MTDNLPPYEKPLHPFPGEAIPRFTPPRVDANASYSPYAPPSQQPTQSADEPKRIPDDWAQRIKNDAPSTRSNDRVPPFTPPALPPQRPRRAKQKRGPSWTGAIVLAILTAALSMGGMSAINAYTSSGNLGLSGAEIATQPPVRNAADQKEPDWQTVAEAVRPSVVAISVQVGNQSETGSGVIFDKAGHILTNYHVIANTDEKGANLNIQLSDGRIYNGSVVGSDPTTDLAVLSITHPPSNLTMTALGSSANLKVGQPVAAIGNPLGLSNTMTTGIISALDRPVTVNQKVKGIPTDQSEAVRVTTNAIQVDAAINPGNSGGPLFNADGSVIGINSSIASLTNDEETKGSIGIGFAIPVDLAKKVADQILQTGEARHGYLGVRVTTNAVDVNGATITGAAIVDIDRNNAVEQAGLEAGDVITKINNHRVISDSSLTGYVRWYMPGDKVTITYVRDGVEKTATVTLLESRS